MAYFYDDWKHKKLTVEDSDGQFFLNFGEAENNMVNTLTDLKKKIEEGDKDTAVHYVEYLIDCLNKRKVELKWNIS